MMLATERVRAAGTHKGAHSSYNKGVRGAVLKKGAVGIDMHFNPSLLDINEVDLAKSIL